MNPTLAAELAAWNAAQDRARAHYDALPMSHNHTAPTPCLTCKQPTQETRGVCRRCRKEKK